MSLAKHLAVIGCDVSWIAGTASQLAIEEMARHGVTCISLNIPSTGSEPPVEKVSNAWGFRQRAWRAIESLGTQALLWVLNGETAIVLGRELKRRRYVLHLYELHESLVKRHLVDTYVRHARAVVCAENARATIVRGWHRLSSTPVTIPNVPLSESARRNQVVDDSPARRTLHEALANGKRVALYQGLIREDRDLTPFCRAFSPRRSWSLVLMGRSSNYLTRLVSEYPSLIYIDHIAAPGHLQVTSWASIGIVAYNNISLNNRHCAPNKIYEYGSFGIPMLANDVPGLTDTVGRYAAGVCVPFDAREIDRAVDRIEANYEPYSEGSQRLFTETMARMSEAAGRVLNLCN